jgi:thiamine-monophosphate kinase
MSQTGFIVEDLPYLKSGLLLAKVLGVAKEILFLGECGEYELLFTLSKDSEEEFSQEAQEKKLSFQRIGEVTQQDTRMLREKDKEIDLRDYALKARDYTDPKEYLRKALEFLNR